MNKDQVLIVRVNKPLADKLNAHKEQTMIPTSAFVRRAIEEKLEKDNEQQS